MAVRLKEAPYAALDRSSIVGCLEREARNV